MNISITSGAGTEVVSYLGVACLFAFLMVVSWVLSIKWKLENERLKRRLKR